MQYTKEIINLLPKGMCLLNLKEQEIVLRRYLLNNSIKEIARKFSLSETRIRQIQAISIKKLRRINVKKDIFNEMD